MLFIKYQKIHYCFRRRDCFKQERAGVYFVLLFICFGLLVGIQQTLAETDPRIPSLLTESEPLDKSWSFPESWETRQEQIHMISAPLAYGPNGLWSGQHLQKHYPAPVYYWLEVNHQAFYYFFSFVTKADTQKVYKKGTISIKRSLKDGAFQSITILLEDMPKDNMLNASFVRLYPAEQEGKLTSVDKGKRPELTERAVLEVTFRGRTLCKQQVLPITFEKTLTMPFVKIRALTAKIINWDILLAPGQKDETILPLVKEIRKSLDLNFEDDAAFDDQGKSVHIKDLSPAKGGVNCSGFVKWVIDGLYYPFKGHYLPINILKEKHLNIRGDRWSTRYEDVCDPFFGLDWSRNLVCQLAEARTGQEVKNKEQFDVREVDFFDYKEDIGYKLKDLRLVLYLLAKKHPGYFYLGSINHAARIAPSLRQHTHLALFFPYFTTEEQYQLVVMESGSETSLANVTDRRYTEEYIHLVAINAQGPLHLLPPSSRISLAGSVHSSELNLYSSSGF